MRPLRLAVLIVAFSATANAGSSAPAKLDASGLAVMDAAVTFCTGVDPGNSRQYQQLRKSAVGDQSDRQLDAMESTPSYKQTYSLVSTMLAGAPHDWAVTTCKNVSVTSGGGDHDKGHDKDNDKGHDDHDKGHDSDHGDDSDHDKGRD